MRSLVGCSPNAGHQLLPQAGAQRTLEAVSCTPWFGPELGRDAGYGPFLACSIGVRIAPRASILEDPLSPARCSQGENPGTGNLDVFPVRRETVDIRVGQTL